MSFLQNLQNRKASLKPARTLVTLTDGRRYYEHSSEPVASSCGFVVDSSPDETPAQVVHNLFIGAQDCCSPAVLRQHGIRCVLSVGVPAPCRLPAVEYHFAELLDLPDADLRPTLARCGALLAAQVPRGPVLVHCNAGVSRSAAVVLGFLIRERGLSYEDAHRLVKTARPAIQPNSGFVTQLRNL